MLPRQQLGTSEAQGATEVRELARFSMRHAYDPSRAIGRQGDHYSDLDLSARAQPFPYATFTFDSTYDVARGDMTTIRLGAFVTDPRPLPATAPLLKHLQRSTTVGVSYRTITDRLLKEMNAYVIFRLNEYLTTAFMGRYDFNADSFIGNRYFVRFISPQKCWYIDLGLIDRVNPQNSNFVSSLPLLGLAHLGGPLSKSCRIAFSRRFSDSNSPGGRSDDRSRHRRWFGVYG